MITKRIFTGGQVTVDREELYSALPPSVADATLEYLRKNGIEVSFAEPEENTGESHE